jgi:hypothetical protein
MNNNKVLSEAWPINPDCSGTPEVDGGYQVPSDHASDMGIGQFSSYPVLYDFNQQVSNDGAPNPELDFVFVDQPRISQGISL